jgi:hypothetical protein
VTELWGILPGVNTPFTLPQVLVLAAQEPRKSEVRRVHAVVEPPAMLLPQGESRFSTARIAGRNQRRSAEASSRLQLCAKQAIPKAVCGRRVNNSPTTSQYVFLHMTRP